VTEHAVNAHFSGMYVVWKFDWLPDFVAGGGDRRTERCCCKQKQTSRSVMDSERSYATANANSEAQKKRQLLSPPHVRVGADMPSSAGATYHSSCFATLGYEK
jgi:hypothetical protein